MIIVDLVGQRFGRLTIKKKLYVRDRRRYWQCVCTCGNTTEVASFRLRNGHTHSCGCLRDEATARMGKAQAKHGFSNSTIYALYHGMLGRCYNPKKSDYHNYGGRGIAVCARWRGPNGFVNFVKDLGPRPTPEHSVERRKNNLGYSPSNCFWATAKEQAQNRRSNTYVRFRGKRLSVSEAARIAGYNPETVRQRLRAGWAVTKALTEPVRPWP